MGSTLPKVTPRVNLDRLIFRPYMPYPPERGGDWLPPPAYNTQNVSQITFRPTLFFFVPTPGALTGGAQGGAPGCGLSCFPTLALHTLLSFFFAPSLLNFAGGATGLC